MTAVNDIMMIDAVCFIDVWTWSYENRPMHPQVPYHFYLHYFSSDEWSIDSIGGGVLS
ncbi:MAG: hypothetical protein HKN79_08735 [Flavobacteriales bacterium]|nr:hypothetical protein [Flavobacteriales bacterium]